MAQKRTKVITEAISNIEQGLATLRGEMESMQETFDSKSERWQEGEKGEELQSDIDTLENSLGTMDDELGTITDLFEEA